MITSNIIERVLFIKYNNFTGTAFTIDVDNKQYLVTARHIFLSSPQQDYRSLNIQEVRQLEIYQHNQWINHQMIPINTIPDGTDIAIFAIPSVLTSTHPAPARVDGLVYGQDMYFLGFPYGITSKIQLHHSGPLPIVKKGIAATLPNKLENDMFYLDAINNVGFSGSPIVFKNGGDPHLNIAGVVSGYRYEKLQVQQDDKDTSFHVKANTGLTICYSLQNHINTIRAKPVGAPIKT